jgi:hypothetical protein
MVAGGYTAIAYVLDRPGNDPPTINLFATWEVFRHHSWRSPDRVSYYLPLSVFEVLLGTNGTFTHHNTDVNGAYNPSVHSHVKYFSAKFDSNQLAVCPTSRKSSTVSAGGCLAFELNEWHFKAYPSPKERSESGRLLPMRPILLALARAVARVATRHKSGPMLWMCNVEQMTRCLRLIVPDLRLLGNRGVLQRTFAGGTVWMVKA